MSNEKEIIEQYEYARARIKQKKRLYYHIVVFGLSSAFLYLLQFFIDSAILKDLYIWLILLWFVLLIYHFIKVYITDKFMNKRWEKIQIDRLMKKQQQRLKTLEENLSPTKTEDNI